MHAQFGNMLVLAAVYRSSIYQHLPHDPPLTSRALDALFARTIEALSETAPNSPILKVDLDTANGSRGLQVGEPDNDQREMIILA
ncbi:hypothetical protein HBI60_254150 [Parastagonospora nodorum]|nr:hypothetical protein HBI60_254150 [Parastagonospora nodorum]